MEYPSGVAKIDLIDNESLLNNLQRNPIKATPPPPTQSLWFYFTISLRYMSALDGEMHILLRPWGSN